MRENDFSLCNLSINVKSHNPIGVFSSLEFYRRQHYRPNGTYSVFSFVRAYSSSNLYTGKGNLSRKKKKERKRNQNKSSLTGSIDRRCKTSHFASNIFPAESYKRNRDRKEKRGRGKERIIRKSCLFLIACHFSVSSYRFFCHLHLYLLLVSPVCLRFPIGRVYVCAINVYINRK